MLKYFSCDAIMKILNTFFLFIIIIIIITIISVNIIIIIILIYFHYLYNFSLLCHKINNDNKQKKLFIYLFI